MSKKKVLVIGGTGIAGQFITDYLLHYHDICKIFDFFGEMWFFVRFCRVEYLSLCAERMPFVIRAEMYGFYGIPSS